MDAERRLLFTQLKATVWTHPVGSGLKALGSGGSAEVYSRGQEG